MEIKFIKMILPVVVALLFLFFPIKYLKQENFGNSIDKLLENCLYINLESRPDRKEKTEKEMQKMGINAHRFNAIKYSPGAIGCSKSHLACIELAKKNNWDYVFICEDDIQFLDPELFRKQLEKFNDNVKDWDVLLVAGNNSKPYEEVGDYALKISNCLTTTGYITKKEYYDKLINNFKNGIENFIKDPENKNQYAIDSYWKDLQKKDRWYLLMPLIVIQREDYSDIENKKVDYKDLMTSKD